MEIKSSILRSILFIAALFALNSCGSKATDPTPSKSSEKSITAFSLSSGNTSWTGTITGTTIQFSMPAGTDVTALVSAITVSAKASVAPNNGVAQNFSKDVNYIVTAEDGSTQTYIVKVVVAPAVTKVIDCSNVPATLPDLGDGVDYIIKCNILLTNSQKLTISPGVTIQFEGVDAGITITNGGALKMIGTAAKPIILKGKTATQGAWTGIQIDSKNTENQWEYVTLQDAGGGANAAGLLIADNAYFLHNTYISLKHCTIKNNKGYGIWDADNKFNYERTVFAAFEENTITNNANAPLCITIDGVGKLDAKSSFTGNAENYIEVHGYEGLHANTVVPKLNVPYLVVGSIELHQRMNVTPGVTFQFYTDAAFNLDQQWNGTGTLIANGTAKDSIKFIGYKAGKGIWLGISLGNNDPEISLKYCVIDGAGSNKPNGSTACISDTKGAVNFYPSCNSYTNKPLITNCRISNSGGYGIIYKKGATTNFTGNVYLNNTLDNVKFF